MEGLARLVAESMARLGLEPAVDHRRLQWSPWFRCESSFDLLLIPAKPGLFAVGEEILAPGELPVASGKRMLAIIEVTEADDLGIAMGRLFSPTSPLRERIATGRMFARYTVIEDDLQRQSAHAALQRWLAQSAETATGVASEASFQSATEPTNSASQTASTSDPGATTLHSEVKTPAPIPAGF
jgi:hypothetical protein